MLKMFVIQQTSIWPNLRLIRNKHKCNVHYVTMHMMTPQILKSEDFTETQKFRHLENEKLLFIQIKKNH